MNEINLLTRTKRKYNNNNDDDYDDKTDSYKHGSEPTNSIYRGNFLGSWKAIASQEGICST
jgi:hypothetical protein